MMMMALTDAKIIKRVKICVITAALLLSVILNMQGWQIIAFFYMLSV